MDRAITKEKDNYDGCFEDIKITDLPKNANLITSHHFLQVKSDGRKGKLKLKCPLVPHGNNKKYKDEVLKDLETGQFPIIRLVLSIAAFLGFTLASIDIREAYLQGGPLGRDIFIYPPIGWASAGRTVWRLIKRAYGIVESVRLWQLAVERWMSGQGIIQVPFLQQLFVKKDIQGNIELVIAKVVDDFLIAGSKDAIETLHQAIGKRFTVRMFLMGKDLIFSRLNIFQEKDGSVLLNMEEYMTKLTKIDISRERKKQYDDAATPEELTRYQ